MSICLCKIFLLYVRRINVDRQAVEERVIEAIRKIQSDSGRPATRFYLELVLLATWRDLIVTAALKLTLLLSEMFGQELPDSVFIPTKGKRILSVAEIAQNIYETVN